MSNHHPSVFNEIFRLWGKINYREISFHETGNVNTIPWTKDIFSSQFYYFFFFVSIREYIYIYIRDISWMWFHTYRDKISFNPEIEIITDCSLYRRLLYYNHDLNEMAVYNGRGFNGIILFLTWIKFRVSCASVIIPFRGYNLIRQSLNFIICVNTILDAKILKWDRYWN